MTFLDKPITFPDVYLKVRDMDDIESEWGKIYNAIGIQKQKEQDKQIRELQEQSRDFNQRLVNLEKNDFRYNVVGFNKKIIEVSEENELQKSEQSMLTNDILKDIEELYDIEDIRDQISYCASIAEKTLKLLKIVKKPDEGNYKKILYIFFTRQSNGIMQRKNLMKNRLIY